MANGNCSGWSTLKRVTSTSRTTVAGGGPLGQNVDIDFTALTQKVVPPSSGYTTDAAFVGVVNSSPPVGGTQQKVTTWFDCPPEAPTTRAFAGILAEGLAGATADEVLAVPDDLYQRMGLSQAISPLRVRGGNAILARLKRQVREQAG